jgi:hypothetical protein
MAMTKEEREARRVLRAAERKRKKALEEIEQEKEQRPVKRMTITIYWKKSRTWGMNPHADVHVEHHDGRLSRGDGFTCSGCGYDKESTVVAEIFNRYFKYELWRKDAPNDKQKRGEGEEGVPYGISAGVYEGIPYVGFSGGVGMSCYYRIAAYMGGELTHVASTNTVDVYIYEDKKLWFKTSEGKDGTLLPENWPEVSTC